MTKPSAETPTVKRNTKGKRKSRPAQNYYSWGNKNTLEDHYARHGSDLGAKDALDYV